MIISTQVGKIIVTPFEVVVKLAGPAMVTMQASSESITLIGRGANVIACHSGDATWSIKLDNVTQLEQIAKEVGLEIT